MPAATDRRPAPALDPADILARLSDLGPPSEIRSRSPRLAAEALGLDRVVLTSIRRGMLVVDAVELGVPEPGGTAARLRAAPVALAYPLVEAEIMRRRRAEVVTPAGADGGGRHAFSEILGATAYALAPVILEGRVVGFFRGDREDGRVDGSDASSLASFAACFAIVYERTVLRQRLRVQHREMRQVASWAETRAGELGDRSITLDGGGEGEAEQASASHPSGAGNPALRDLLTAREREVVELMVRGDTNAAIARELVLSAGTVKFHVKNILRKLQASNRAEATSRYLRLTLAHRPAA